MQDSSPKRLIIGISGASGIIYGIRLLELLKPTAIETHLVVSKAAELTRSTETSYNASYIRELADVCYQPNDIAASIASGSVKTMGMIVAPCSMHTLAEIAQALSSNLLTRAADVVLKERRRLVLLTRETPLNQAHLENMLKVTQMGGIIAPPVPAFYNSPQTVDDLINNTVGRVLDLFDIDLGILKRWKEVEKK
jgi:4-hydroxy-3-polyprenylbenzoate decarboxylase